MTPSQHDTSARPLVRPRLRVALACVVGLLLAISGCGGHQNSRGRDPDGPLSASSGRGGFSVTAPRPSSYTATFGAFVLCSTEPDIDITIDDVRYRSEGDTEDAKPLVRTFDAEDLAALDRHQVASYQPVVATLGSPPSFSEPYAGYKPRGDFINQVAGWTVSQTCTTTEEVTMALTAGRVPVESQSELMFVIEAGSGGARIPGFHIDYSAGGNEYTLNVPFEMVACGTGFGEKESCA